MSPLIFIKLSESTVGDTDMIISPISAINDTRYIIIFIFK